MRPLQPEQTKSARSERWMLLPLLGIAGLLLIFSVIAYQVLEGSTTGFDRFVILAFRAETLSLEPIGPPWLQEAARDITALGSIAVVGTVVFAVVLYLILAGKRAAACLVLVAVPGGVALNSLLKFAFSRARPDFISPAARVFTESFPSGHATVSAITYLTLAALLARTTPTRDIRVYFIVISLVLTLLVGVSRVYLGVHYPTDILAGWCIGAAWALVCWTLMTRLQQTGQVEPPSATIPSNDRTIGHLAD